MGVYWGSFSFILFFLLAYVVFVSTSIRGGKVSVCVCLRQGGRLEEGPPSRAQREPRCLLAQLPGQRGASSNGKSRTAFRLREKVTHCRYKSANQQQAQRCSPNCRHRGDPPRRKVAPPRRGSPDLLTACLGVEPTYVIRPPAPLYLLRVCPVAAEKGVSRRVGGGGGGGWPGLVRYVPLSG